MPTKTKFSLNGSVRSVAVFHDQNLAIWRKIVEDLKKILRRLHQEREHVEKIQNFGSTVQLVQAGVLRNAVESGDGGITLLINRVDAMLALIEGGGQIGLAATPAPVPATAVPQDLLAKIARLIGYDRKPPYDEADLLEMLKERLDDHPLLDPGKFAMRELRRLLGFHVGLTAKEIDGDENHQGMKTIEIEKQFKVWLEEILDLLDDVAEKITGKRDASNAEIAEALAKLEATKANGNVSTVRADDPRIKLLAFVLEKLGLDAKASKQDAERAITVLKLAQARVDTINDFRSRTLVALIGADDPEANIEDVEQAIRSLKQKAGVE